jgi:enoyl-CoA hydratase/carnithine racemase
MTELVHYEAGGGVATITLDSPHNRNALSRQLVTELYAGLAAAEADESVKVVVIRAEGGTFCSGADLSEAATTSMEEGARGIVELQRRILALPKPVVTRLHGNVRAGGIGIVAASDVAISADDATYALTEVRLALAPAAISLTVLPRMTSRAAALTALTGDKFTGAEAAEMGLVTRAVPLAELDATVDAVCASLVQGAPQGLRETKALLTRPLLERVETYGDELAALSARLFGSEEARAALLAFLSGSR